MARTIPGRASDLLSYSVALAVLPGLMALRWQRTPPALEHSLPAVFLAALWCEHFARRIIECLWVHRYSNRRVPIADALGEYAYYWGFGAWIGWSIGSPKPPGTSPIALVVVGTCLFAVGEFGNAWAHVKLRRLRPPNTVERGIPRGGLFELVSSPNYTYEILAWSGFALAAQRWSAVVYLVGVIGVLASWARKRHERYHRWFDGRDGRATYPLRRRALVPWIFLSLP